ncbi:MAG: 50S ribosomal protein L1 [Candidatus Geothermarchaeales archaeon]
MINLTKEQLTKAIGEAKEKGGKRSFEQSVELIVTTEGLDLGKPENRVLEIIRLPKKTKKEGMVCVFAEGETAERAAEVGADRVISRRELDALAGNRKEIKKISKRYDFFLAEPPLMGSIGKVFGFALGPKGKMPQVITPTTDLKGRINALKNSVRIYLRNRPEASCSIGTESTPSEDLAENALAVISTVDRSMEEKAKTKNVYIKLSMGKPVKVI